MMSGKERWLAMHERMTNEYLDANPSADWATAYERTADGVQERVIDDAAAEIDAARDRAKEGGL